MRHGPGWMCYDRVPDSWLDVRLFCTGSTDLRDNDHKQNDQFGKLKEAVIELDGTEMINKQAPQLRPHLLGQRRYSLTSPFFLKPR